MATDILVSQCVLDYDLYPRHSVDESHVNALAEALKAGAVFPAVILDRVTFRVIDGFHRIEATRKVGSDDATISAELRDYPSETAMFAEAMLYNSRHGRRLTSYDRTRCVLLAREMGLGDEQTAQMLQISREKLDNLMLTRTAIGADEAIVPLKLTSSAALAGKTIGPLNVVANKAAGGMSVGYYCGQILNALGGGLVDWSNKDLIHRLQVLHATLGNALMSPPMEEAA